MLQCEVLSSAWEPPAPRLAIALLAAAAALSACSLVRTPPRPPAAVAPAKVQTVPDAVPRPEPRSAQGNPPYYDALGKRYYVLASANGYAETGVASWYGPDFQAKRTSSGEVYDMYGMTAAHKTLPLPTYARVTNLSNGRSVVVRINDRGPFVSNRIIDLSYTAAAKLDMLRDGTAVVEVRAITSPGQMLPPAPLLQASQPPPAPAPAPNVSSAPAAAVAQAMPLTEEVATAVAPAREDNPAPAAPEAAAVPATQALPADGAAADVAAAGVAGAAAAQASDTAAPPAQAAPAAVPPPAAAHANPSKAVYLQAGAYSDPRHAQAVLARLKEAGIAAAFLLEPAAGSSTPLFRVRIGPLPSVDDIDRAAQRLAALGFADARVVSDLARP